MKTIKILSLMVLTVWATSCIQAQDKQAYNIDNSGVGLQGYSPVSYLDLGKAQLGKKDYKATHEGVTYYFTSADQKATFKKNPKKYLPQYGGYCAFGVYAGAKFRVDPNNFIVKDGKYFLYLNNLEVDAKQLWEDENNHSDLKKKADSNWEKLSKTYN
ncbi:MAG: YHS domain-containing (seleno)protein [Reichenbachiella sp.]|uniref:YHS domain-containing (seleno)protein n=1 Tax=Reichenbachiella sp. TaxID=2184521 RepID=UPI0032630102